eukprot:5215013-Pyramimonas_sp.AAC.1
MCFVFFETSSLYSAASEGGREKEKAFSGGVLAPSEKNGSCHRGRRGKLLRRLGDFEDPRMGGFRAF